MPQWIIWTVLGMGVLIFMFFIWCILKIGQRAADIAEEVTMREDEDE